MEQGRLCVADTPKPSGPSCYYLVLLYTSPLSPELHAADIAFTWALNERLESLKVSFNVKIKLYINALARSMARHNTRLVQVEMWLKELISIDGYSAKSVMWQIAWAQEPTVWDPPLTQ